MIVLIDLGRTNENPKWLFISILFLDRRCFFLLLYLLGLFSLLFLLVLRRTFLAFAGLGCLDYNTAIVH